MIFLSLSLCSANCFWPRQRPVWKMGSRIMGRTMEAILTRECHEWQPHAAYTGPAGFRAAGRVRAAIFLICDLQGLADPLQTHVYQFHGTGLLVGFQQSGRHGDQCRRAARQRTLVKDFSGTGQILLHDAGIHRNRSRRFRPSVCSGFRASPWIAYSDPTVF